MANLRSRWLAQRTIGLAVDCCRVQNSRRQEGQAAPVDHEPRAIPVAVPAGSAVSAHVSACSPSIAHTLDCGTPVRGWAHVCICACARAWTSVNACVRCILMRAREVHTHACARGWNACLHAWLLSGCVPQRAAGLRRTIREYCSYCSLLFTCVCSSPKHALESIQLIWYLREYNQ